MGAERQAVCMGQKIGGGREGHRPKGCAATHTVPLSAAPACGVLTARLVLCPTQVVPGEMGMDGGRHYEAELEINDFPQHARWKVGAAGLRLARAHAPSGAVLWRLAQRALHAAGRSGPGS